MTGQAPPRLPPPAPPVIGSAPPIIAETRRPGVVRSYRAWCVLFVLLYVVFGVLEILVARGSMEPNYGLLEDFASRHDRALRDRLAAEKRAEAPGTAAFCFLIAIGYSVGAAIPRKPWAWIFGILVLASTIFPFVITGVGSALMLAQWSRPEVKRYFGRLT